MAKRKEVMNKILDYARNNLGLNPCKLPPEREMAKTFGVSRVLLREAIVALEVMGFLEIRDRDGIYIKTLQLDFIKEDLKSLPIWPDKFLPQFLEMRTIIEVNAAQIAATKRTEEQLQAMEACLSRLKSEIEKNSDIAVRAHYEFILHCLVVEAANNDIMKKIYESLRALMEKYHLVLHQCLTQEPDWEKQVLQDQIMIFEAIKNKDPQTAAECMKKHMQQNVEQYDIHKGYSDFI